MAFKNKEDAKAYSRDYWIKNKESESARIKAWKLKNKEKIKQQSKEYREANKEKEKAQKKEYYIKNKETILARNKQYRDSNPDKVSKQISAWREKNIGRVQARLRKYQAGKIKRTPSWLTEIDKFEMECIYKYAAALNGVGLNYHVDHIIPLQGKIVSGLHLPENLQVMQASENIKKQNKFEVANVESFC